MDGRRLIRTKDIIRLIRRLSRRPTSSTDPNLEDNETGDSLAHDLIYQDNNVTDRVRQLITSMSEEMRQDLHALRNDIEMTWFDLAVDRDRKTLVEHVLSKLSEEERYDILTTEQPGLGWTPLYRAIVRSNAGMVSTLLRSINPTQRQQLMSTEDGLSTMTRVLLYEPFNVVEAILEQLEPNGRYTLLQSSLENELPLIHQLVMTGRHGVLQWILRNCAGRCLPLIQLKDNMRRTILHLALKNQDLTMMEIILRCLNQNDANRVLLESDKRHMLAIHYAAESTSRQFSRKATRLVINSISPDLIPFMVTQRTSHNITPFERAFQVGNIDAMQVIARALQRNPAILLPAQGGAPRNTPHDSYVPSPTGTASFIPRQPSTETISSVDEDIEDALSRLPGDRLMINITESLDCIQINTETRSGENIPSLSKYPTPVVPQTEEVEQVPGIPGVLTENHPETDNLAYVPPTSAASVSSPEALTLNPNEILRQDTLSIGSSQGLPRTLTTRPIEMEKGTLIEQPVDASVLTPHVMDSLKEGVVASRMGHSSYISYHQPALASNRATHSSTTQQLMSPQNTGPGALTLNPNEIHRQDTLPSDNSSGQPRTLTAHPREMAKETNTLGFSEQPADASVSSTRVMDNLWGGVDDRRIDYLYNGNNHQPTSASNHATHSATTQQLMSPQNTGPGALTLNPNEIHRQDTLPSDNNSGQPRTLTTHPIEMEKATSIEQPVDASVLTPHVDAGRMENSYNGNNHQPTSTS